MTPAALRALVVVAWVLVGSACRVEVGAPRSAACETDAAPTGTVVLYTSAYREVVEALTALVAERLPEVKLEVFQAGSEKVATRLEADLQAGQAGPDILLTSDPFTYRRLRDEGQLLAYASPEATPVPRALVDLDNAFVAARISTMVIAFHEQHAATAPTSFAALVDDAHARDVAWGDPLASGTTFMTTVLLDREQPGFLRRLRNGGAAIGGGNAVVLQRLLSGERRYGAVLLENVLAARARGEPAAFVIPSDGAVVIPGDVAILKGARNPGGAKAVVDVILSEAFQEIVRGTGAMHAADPRVPPPAADVPPLDVLLRQRPLDEATLAAVAKDRARVVTALQQALEESEPGATDNAPESAP